MALPNPDRTFPNTDDIGPPGPTGADYADKVAAEGQALWDRIINVLGNLGGSANAITADCDPPLVDSYKHGQQFWLTPGADNTGAVTINVDGRGAVDLVAFDGSALQAGDLVAGEGTPLAFDSATGDMRLMHPTARALMAMAGGGGEQAWETIGDTGALGTVANVEFTFVAGRYSRIVMVSQGLVGAANFRGPQHTLRNSSAAIVAVSGGGENDARLHTYRSEFLLDTVSATGVYYGCMDGAHNVVDTFAATGNVREARGANATPADRVRVEMVHPVNKTPTNITAGRVIAWGQRATA